MPASPPSRWSITEPWYEFAEGSAPAMDVRFAAWSAILSGAAGHTYGGGHQWWADIPDPSLPPRKDSWPRPPLSVDTLDYPGAVSMGFLAKFLKGMEWWKLEPHPELVLEYPQPLASAIAGQEYLVYARYGGQLKLDLRSSSESDRFRFHLDRPGCLEGSPVRNRRRRRHPRLPHSGRLPRKPGL